MPAPSKMAFWIMPRRDRVEQVAARQMCRAGYSNLNWHAETRAAIEVAAVDAGRDALSRWDPQPADDPSQLQIRIHADCLAGTAGRARISRQMETFRFVSCASMATALPTARSACLVLKLKRRAARFAAQLASGAES